MPALPQIANPVADWTVLQAHGTGHELTIGSIMAWRLRSGSGLLEDDVGPGGSKAVKLNICDKCIQAR